MSFHLSLSLRGRRALYKYTRRLLKYSQSTPYIPQSRGIFKAGGHPQTPGRKYPAPLFQQSLNDGGLSANYLNEIREWLIQAVLDRYVSAMIS